MLTEKQILEVREHLERAQNPIFYYDNDADGLCSYVLLRKFIDRGKGVSVRSFPDLNGSYARKAQELNADYVFVLDKPALSKEFVDEINNLGLPLVWIDHHDVSIPDYEKDLKNFFVYNPARNSGKDKSEEPVTYLCYKIADRKEDVWLGVVGCISDHYLPDFVSEFKVKYPDLWTKRGVDDPFVAYYETEIGRIAMALNFGLKDSTTNIIRMQNFLISAKEPGEVFSESGANLSFRKRFEIIKKKYDLLMEKAMRCVKDNVVFFEYSGDLSISADISNALSYRFPGKYIVVAYKKGAISNMSLRGKNVKRVIEKVFKEVEGGGGGHEDAVGARVNTDDLGKFEEVFTRVVEDKLN